MKRSVKEYVKVPYYKFACTLFGTPISEKKQETFCQRYIAKLIPGKGVALHLFITGKVTGVGFRKWVRKEAKKHKLISRAANRDERTVEVFLIGSYKGIKKFAQYIASGPPRAKVEGVRGKYFHKSNTTIVIEPAGEREKLPKQEENIDVTSKEHLIYSTAGWLETINQDFVRSVQNYWQKSWGAPVDPTLHLAFSAITGKEEVTIVPTSIVWKEIVPVLNGPGKKNVYRDKNLYDYLIPTKNAPETVIKRVRGQYFSGQNEIMTSDVAWQKVIDRAMDVIIKPSTTNDGTGVQKITWRDNQPTIDQRPVDRVSLEEFYGPNFIIQEVIQQHPVMAVPHPDSVNTLRMVTLRLGGEIHYLLTFARFGVDGSVRDNAGTGGICCGITDNGEFMDFAIDEKARKHFNHPTTGFAFGSGTVIPDFKLFKNFVVELHHHILHHDLYLGTLRWAKMATRYFSKLTSGGRLGYISWLLNGRCLTS